MSRVGKAPNIRAFRTKCGEHVLQWVVDPENWYVTKLHPTLFFPMGKGETHSAAFLDLERQCKEKGFKLRGPYNARKAATIFPQKPSRTGVTESGSNMPAPS